MSVAPNPFDNDSETLAERLTSALSKIGLALKSQAWHNAGARGLTPTQGQILSLLLAHTGDGMRLSEIAEGLAVTPATASDAVSALVDKGLVRKQRAKQDSRAIAVTLTASGKREANRAANWPEFLLHAAETLSHKEQEEFLHSLIKIIRALQKRGQIPISQMCVTCRHFQPHVHDDAERPHHCGLVNAPLARRHLRIACPEQEIADDTTQEANWRRFSSNDRSAAE